MKNKRPIQILVVFLAVMFLATVVQANEKNYKHSWYNPFAGIWKKIGDLNGNLNKMDRKISRMDRKIDRLQVNGIAGPPGPKGEKGDMGPAGPPGSAGGNARLICPGCNFSKPESNTTQLSLKATIEPCNGDWTGFDFANAYLNFAFFNEACLYRTNFSGAQLRNAYFIKAQLIGADFSGSDLTNADFAGADLTGANIAGAIMDGVNWSSYWDGDATCPDGYIINKEDPYDTCEGHFTN